MTNPKKFLSLKKSCAGCPFSKAETAVKLRYERREGIAATLIQGTTFSCHKTVDYSNEDEPDTSESVLCFGAASALHKGGYPPVQAERIAARLGFARDDYECLETDTTYDSPEDFIYNAPEC